MRILSVHNRYQERGGEDVVFEAEAELLERHGHSVVRLIFENSSIPHRASPRAAVGLAATTIWSRTAAARVRTAIRDARPDVAHFHNTVPLVSPAAYRACRGEGVAVVQTLHNYRLLCPSATFFRDGHPCEDCLGRTPPWPAVLHACYRASRRQTAVLAMMLTAHRIRKTWINDVDVFVALTEFSRRKFIEGGLPGARLAVKPNFLEPDPGTGSSARSGYFFAGRLVEEKGIRTLLAAWSDERINAPLRIAGAGPLAAEVTTAARRRPNIQYLERLDRRSVLEEMRRARALIFPSLWYEGFAVTIVEAFASGLPVIASRIGVMPEIIDDGRIGRLFEAGDPAALAEAVAGSEAQASELERMGAEARREYVTKYSGAKNLGQLIALYERAIDTARSR